MRARERHSRLSRADVISALECRPLYDFWARAPVEASKSGMKLAVSLPRSSPAERIAALTSEEREEEEAEEEGVLRAEAKRELREPH